MELCTVFLLDDIAVIVYQEEATYQYIKRASVSIYYLINHAIN